MAPRIKYFWIAVGFLPVMLRAQTTPEMARVLERLDRLEQENRALSEEVRRLGAELAASRTGAADSAPNLTVDQRLDIHESRIEEHQQTKIEASQKFPIRLAGMALFNAFLNSKQSGGADYPVVASAPGPGHGGATVRQSIIGLEFENPAALAGGKVHGSIYMDFFAGANNNAFRVRTASIQMDWKSTSVAGGLEKPIFNPREPSSLAQVGISPLTGAGNLWLWLPQFRVEHEFAFIRSTGVRAQLGAVQTREIGPYVGTVVPEAARPALEGRFNFFHRFDEQRKMELAAGFHKSTTHAAGRSIPSNVFALDWFFNPWKPVEFSGVFYTGKNVAHLGSGTRQGYAVYSRYAYGVPSMGGWGQVTIHAARRWDLHAFTGQVDDGNGELMSGAIAKNLLFGGNAYFRVAPNVLVGLETTQLRTSYVGLGRRINNHYDLALAYIF